MATQFVIQIFIFRSQGCLQYHLLYGYLRVPTYDETKHCYIFCLQQLQRNSRRKCLENCTPGVFQYFNQRLCTPHFNQAVWRKTQELDLKTMYDTRGPEDQYIRSPMAPPFLLAAEADMQPVFDPLEPRANSTEFRQLVRYL
ncbi:hypothetical protein CHS0354_023351 [Potamilus streckersoni]|uniref:Uncharacterized protein n=1 Tax=Potamilus streckersoni TaxID=2493646 RepID=A0AAE0W7X5_9BIVA|nr:hypothetical protein CHS0354_023351 [Potamilus streckersoni]